LSEPRQSSLDRAAENATPVLQYIKDQLMKATHRSDRTHATYRPTHIRQGS